MKFSTAVYSDPGSRDINEDFLEYFVEENAYAIWVIADGLGGHSAGEVASKMVVENFISEFKNNPNIDVNNINRIVNATNENILATQKLNASQRDMKSTLVCLVSDFASAVWCHVGDSRLYHFRDNKLMHQTEDHSVSQLSVLAGEITKDEIRFHEDRNKLLRVLGDRGNINSDISKPKINLCTGDVFLLCSDGFWENILEGEMEDCLSASNDSSLWLCMMTNIVNSRLKLKLNNDNLSAVSVFVEGSNI